MFNKFVVIDLETTGNIPKKGDKIIQFAAVVIENGMITEQYSSLINPQKAIPVFIEELTGINDEMVVNAPIFSEIAPKVISLLDGAYFVAHNVLFDLSFLQEELINANYEGFYGPVLDTVELARILYPTADGYKLSDLAEQENLRHDRPHQADSDAEVTAELLLIFLNRLMTLPRHTLKQLVPLAGGLKSDLQQLLDEMLEQLEGTEITLPQHIEIFKGIALKKTSPQPDFSAAARNTSYPEHDEDKINILHKGFKSFEKRIGQFQMMDAVYDALLADRHLLIEAGTGVGKSLGYLLPAAYFSQQCKRPIVISTFTIPLQEQLLRKEIPFLNKLLPFNIQAVLLKGRSHYLNLEKFHQTLLDENDNYDTTLTKMQILVWLTETETGDKDELNLSSGGQIFWDKVRNGHAVYETNSDWLEKDFFLKAKRDAAKADLIITNHSLLLSDMTGKGPSLPRYDYAIIDEGHHLEKSATQFLGASLDYLSIRLFIGKFGTYDQSQLFYQMEEIVNKLAADKEIAVIPPFELNQLVLDLMYEIDEFFKLLVLYANTRLAAGQRLYRAKVPYSRFNNEKEGKAVSHSAERIAFLLKDLELAIKERLKWIISEGMVLTSTELNKLEEIQIFLTELADLRETVVACFLSESNHVKWIEIDSRSPQNITTFIAQPATVADKLKENLFNAKKAVIVTSASLTVNHSFQYILKGLGLDPVLTETVLIPSPFDYKKQVQLLIPEDLPEINTVTLDEFVISLAEQIISIAEAARGRMLILFTSYDMLKKTYELIKESGFLDDYVLMAQGISSGSPARLTRNFKRYDKAILLGTNSFWEGIDIPGEDLSCLCIVRLPFSSPEEPLTEAKSKLILERGGNPFIEHALPEAVLRFKQGFGRLIRTENDKGIIVVFDKRIITTKYGNSFFESIPPVSVRKGPVNELVQIIHTWI